MSDRAKRREVKKTGKPVKVDQAELAAMAAKSEEINNFVAMLNEDLYSMRMVKGCVDAGIIDSEEAIKIDSVYDLPMMAGFKGTDDLLLADYAIEVFSRFKLATGISKKGNQFEALLVDYDDDFFNYVKDTEKQESAGEEYEKLYYSAVKNVMSALSEGIMDQIFE